jgi:hypothetical protein
MGGQRCVVVLTARSPLGRTGTVRWWPPGRSTSDRRPGLAWSPHPSNGEGPDFARGVSPDLCSLADFDHDGRTDLVFTQHGAETRVFRNLGMRPGLRVGLAGPAGNPNGAGAVVRLLSRDGLGPAHIVLAGSGHLSQDSLVPVLTSSNAATAVRVRWPGGKETESPVLPGAKAVNVTFVGEALASRGSR